MRFTCTILLLIALAPMCKGQMTASSRKARTEAQTGNPAVVIDERLSVLRRAPSLYAEPVKRLKTGATITVSEEENADGVIFYKAADSTAAAGWIQSEAIAGTFRKNDDQRLVRLILGSTGFTQIHRASIFLKMYPESKIRPAILLLYGDLIESDAAEISKHANEKLVRREMAAARAPVHSFYLNFDELDKYRDLGIRFLFNAQSELLHYNGDSWFEITRKFPESEQSIEARERIRALEKKMSASN